MLNAVHSVTCDPKQFSFFLIENKAMILCNMVTYLIKEALTNGDCSSKNGMKSKNDVIYLNWIQSCWKSAHILILRMK
jgi:hypothetical protein